MKGEQRIFAVIDTNVLVSSLLSRRAISNPLILIRAVLDGVIVPLYNHEIIEEYRDVLGRDKFKFNAGLVDDLISAFIESGIDTERTRVDDEEFVDSDDIVFYEVAMSVDDSFLVTGNTKHFPRKAFVVTPSEMVEILTEKGLL